MALEWLRRMGVRSAPDHMPVQERKYEQNNCSETSGYKYIYQLDVSGSTIPTHTNGASDLLFAVLVVSQSEPMLVNGC